MTHENNQGAENLNWMEIAESDAINDVRHTSRRLPYVAAAVSLLIIGAGALFAQTGNEAPAQATENVVAVDPTASPLVPSPSTPSTPDATTVPVIPNVSPSVGGRGYDDDEDDDRGWFGGHDDDDDDDYRGDRHGDDDDEHEEDDD
jgi:hypothetical protein